MVGRVEDQKIGTFEIVEDVGVVIEVLLLQVRKEGQDLGVNAGYGSDELLLLELIVILVVVFQILNDEVDHHDVIRMTAHPLNQKVEKLVIEIAYHYQITHHRTLDLLQL